MNDQSSQKMSSPIAIDGRALSGRRAGIGRYTLGVLLGLLELGYDRPVILYLGKGETSLPFIQPPNWTYVEAPASLLGSYWLSQDAKKRGAAALLAASTITPAVFSPIPTVTIIYDLSVWRCLESKPSLRTRLAEGLLLGASVRRSAKLVGISKFTRDELIALYPDCAPKTAVAYGAVDSQFQVRTVSKIDVEVFHALIAKHQLPKSFLLTVGTLEPRKNVARLLLAYDQLPAALQQEFPLVLVGKLGWSTNEIMGLLTKLEERGSVRRLNYVTDQELPYLYNLATIVAYPSLYEGFGLPALEALASGVPLLTSNRSAIPEVVEDAALMVDPYTTTAIKDGLQKLMTEPKLRQDLARRGPRQAAVFTWGKSAATYAKVFEALLAA